MAFESVSNDNKLQKCAYKRSNKKVETLGPPQPCAYDSSNKNTNTGFSTSICMPQFEIKEVIHENVHIIVDPWVGSIPPPL